MLILSSTFDVNLFIMEKNENISLILTSGHFRYPGTPLATEAVLSLSLIKLIQLKVTKDHVEKLSMKENIRTGNCVFN